MVPNRQRKALSRRRKAHRPANPARRLSRKTQRLSSTAPRKRRQRPRRDARAQPHNRLRQFRPNRRRRLRLTTRPRRRPHGLPQSRRSPQRRARASRNLLPQSSGGGRRARKVVKEIGDRIVIQINNQIIVESSDRPRMSRGAREVYYEDLPRGRTRETVVRGDGTEVVTIRNAYGDIIRRSRITPDGREYVLVYVDEQYYDRARRLARSGPRPAADAARRASVRLHPRRRPGRRSRRLLRLPGAAAGRTRRAPLFGRRGQAFRPHSRQDAARRARHGDLRVRLGRRSPKARSRGCKASPTPWSGC